MTRYRLRASLVGSEPEIWRVFDIDGRLRLPMLHAALQVMFGWRDVHLHEFADGDPHSGSAERRWSADGAPDGALREDGFSIDSALATVSALWYEYDFGDGWLHRIDVTERMGDERHLAAVVVIDGAEAGPFEDAGGIAGYADKRAIAADPRHPEHASIRDWIAVTVGPWRAAEFDPIAVQSELNLLFNPDESGIDPLEASGLVKIDPLRSTGDLHAASPISVLAEQLPAPLRSELRQHLGRRGLLDPGDVEAGTAARIVRAFGWLVRAVGREGMDLTSAGWMPPAVVLAGMTELGWIDDWIGKGNREDLTPPIANLREVATRIGLVRKQKGRLLLSAAAKEALDDPTLLLRLVSGVLYRGLGEAETDAAVLHLLSIADGTPAPERWRTVSFGLAMCGWTSSTGQEFTALDIRHAVSRTQDVLDLVGDGSWRRRRPGDDDPLLREFAREALR